MSDANSVAQAIFAGCGANVGPLIGTELEPGEVTVETRSDLPEGELAVLPITCEIDEELLANLTLSSPINEIVTLARRMLGDEEPDKERELSEDDIDAVGEVLNLMSGAIDQVVREQVNGCIRSRPLEWWQSANPGDHHFEEGEILAAEGSINIPGGQPVHFLLRLPPKLLEQGSHATASHRNGQILLLGLDEELEEQLGSILKGALMDVHTRALDTSEAEIEDALPTLDAILLPGEEPGFERTQALRLSNHFWTVPTILCMKEPDREKVVRAVQAGASHVLRVPAEDTTILRVLRTASALGD